MDNLSNKTVSPVSCNTGTPDFSWSLKNSSIYNLDCVTNAQDTVNSQIEANANIIANSEEIPLAETAKPLQLYHAKIRNALPEKEAEK